MCGVCGGGHGHECYGTVQLKQKRRTRQKPFSRTVCKPVCKTARHRSSEHRALPCQVVVVKKAIAQNLPPDSQNGPVHQVRSEPEGRFRWPCRPCAPPGSYLLRCGSLPVHQLSPLCVTHPCLHPSRRLPGACACMQQPAPGPPGSQETPSLLTWTQSECGRSQASTASAKQQAGAAGDRSRVCGCCMPCQRVAQGA